MRYLFHYIENKKLLTIFSLITFQQILNALGTYTLAKAGLSFAVIQHFVLWTIASLLLFILTPAVNIFIRRIESELSFNVYRVYLQETLFSKSGNANLWQSKDHKDRFLASIGSDASDYLGLVLFISMDIYSFILSVVLGVLTLSFTIDLSLLPAFLVSGILSFFVYRRSSKKIESLYNVDQAARTELTGHLLKSWDNVLLKNKDVLANYQKGFDERISSAQNKAMKSTTASELLIFILSLSAGLPVLSAVCWILWSSSANTQLLIALLATLPRQLNILGLFRSIFQGLTSLLSVETKFDTLYKGTNIPERILEKSIQANLITLNQKPIKDLNSLKEEIAKNPSGRFEVRGANGSGKSTLLLLLNHELPMSVYLPTHPNLMITKESTSPLSSGQNLLAHIEFLSQSSESVILLDEWDANLDAENLHFVNIRIEELARSKTVVEVRHR